jgi:hypothetical protein
LLAEGRDAHAEALGTAFKLDILHLYETAADECFRMQDYGRALGYAETTFNFSIYAIDFGAGFITSPTLRSVN